MAHFSEILRNNIHDPEQLSFNVIKDLTKYVNAIQGGFYMLDDTDPGNRFFNLTAFFAFDRKKFADQRIKWGDGLIGTCAMEQKIIHMKNVPDGYISVTSGLGDANPGSLLIVPMQYENDIYGVLEFASFNKFENIQITLIEKVAESTASTLSTVKTNIKTAKLLEESKATAQALSSQEEEMRQNMEELQATQEELTRQNERFTFLENTINKKMLRAEFNPDGKLLFANDLFLDLFEYSNELILQGKHISELISADTRDLFDGIWKSLVNDNKDFQGVIKHVTRTGRDLWTLAILSCARNEDSSANKIIMLAMDITGEKDRDIMHENICDAISDIGIRLELDVNGNILDFNENFTKVFKYSRKEIKLLVVFDIIDPLEVESFNKRWDTIIKGTDFIGTVKTKARNGEVKWVYGIFKTAFNMSHEIDRIYFIGNDITHERQLETEVKTKGDSLKKLEKILRESEKDFTNRLRNAKTELQDQFRETERLKAMTELTLENSNDAIITIGHDNRIVFFNKAAEILWGYDRKDILHQDITMLLPDELTARDELLNSFTRQGDHKITGIRKNARIIDKKGKERSVKILLSKAKVDNENSYTAFIQSIE
jgi:PAS domain S-box-containing protein